MFFQNFQYIISAQVSDTLTALVEGKVTDFEGKIRKGENITFISRKESLTVSSDGNGQFQCRLRKGRVWQVYYESLINTEHYDSLIIPDASGQISVKLSLKIQTPDVIILRNVFFDTGKSILKPQSYPELNKLVKVLQRRASMEIELAGHTDSIGSDEYNLQLSSNRAEAVRQYLISKGISPSRINAVGYGKNQPIDTNGTETGRANNRRTEVRIIRE